MIPYYLGIKILTLSASSILDDSYVLKMGVIMNSHVQKYKLWSDKCNC